MSLDGFIAKPDGDINWLNEIPNPEESDYGYAEFYDSIDTTFMGNNTYKQVIGFDINFPYVGKSNYVFTKDTNKKKDENVTFVSENIVSFIQDLKSENGKDIWLIGGGQLNTLLLNNNLIDEMIVFVMPIILGKGLPLFSSDVNVARPKLSKTNKYASGVVEFNYSFAN